MEIILFIIIFFAFAGNVLLFSGQASSENWVVIFLAVVVDIITFIFTIVEILEKAEASAKEKERKEAEERERKISEEKARKVSEKREQVRKIEEEQIKKQLEEKKKEEIEKKRIQEVMSKIADIKASYTLRQFPFTVSESIFSIEFDSIFINNEISRVVKEFKKDIGQLIRECKSIDNRINCILSYNFDPDSVLNFLLENTEILQSLKEQSDYFRLQICKRKIMLLNENVDAIKCIKNAFITLDNSEKCVSDHTTISTLIEGETPLELNMFSYMYEPFILHLQDFCYCFFGNVILVFDNEGVFVKALDPTILRLTIKRYTEYVYKSDYYQNSKYTGSDSHIVTTGETRQTWMHTRVNGYPDLRYSYNPKISYHTDEVMYGEVSFYLSEKLTYTFSSYQAIIAFEKAKEEYEKKYNDRRDTLPDFLKLIQLLEPEDTVINDIFKKYKFNSKNYFCQIT